MKHKLRIGVDTGGTFTDFVFYRDGKIVTRKIPSTPQNPALAIIQGIKHSQPQITFIVHGTTVATNALLERKGGKIALITTKGFEDVLFIGRQTRHNLYSLKPETRVPLLPRKMCYGLEERINSSGDIESNVSADELKKIIHKIKQTRAEAVAISLINSYTNSAHEAFVAKELEKSGLLVSVSSHLLPEYREYERTTLTAVNAYLMPVISVYLKNLEEAVGKAELRIMQSNEGYISPAAAKTEPIRTALSGPAGGVVAAARVAKAAGFKNIITFDMGGTSSDVSLVPNQIQRTSESQVGEFPIRLPIIDIHTVGAGGGSIAYLDLGGSLRVGPQSAGADPGPACYGKGREPTVTDANLVLGRLAPDFFLGGTMQLYPARSREAISRLAKKIKKSILDTADGIIQIANANMEKAIRVISIERGIDPRSFSLLSFGGAGGMHAAEMASHLNIARVIVPKNAGVLSAMGLLLADSIKDYSQSVLTLSEKVSTSRLERLFSALNRQGLQDMEKEGFFGKNIKITQTLDLRYLGQSYEISIPYLPNIDFVSAFHKAHQKLYSYHHQHQPVEIVNIRIRVIGLSRKIRLTKSPHQSKSAKRAFLRTQEMHYQGKKFQGHVYDRTQLQTGNIIAGPALIADLESTTFLPPFHWLQVDGYSNLILQRKKFS